VPGCNGKSFFFKSFITSTNSLASLLFLAKSCNKLTIAYQMQTGDRIKEIRTLVCLTIPVKGVQMQHWVPIHRHYASTKPSFLLTHLSQKNLNFISYLQISKTKQHSFIKDKTDTQIKHTKIKGSGMNTCLSNFTTEVAVKIVMYAKI